MLVDFCMMVHLAQTLLLVRQPFNSTPARVSCGVLLKCNWFCNSKRSFMFPWMYCSLLIFTYSHAISLAKKESNSKTGCTIEFFNTALEPLIFCEVITCNNCKLGGTGGYCLQKVSK